MFFHIEGDMRCPENFIEYAYFPGAFLTTGAALVPNSSTDFIILFSAESQLRAFCA